MSRKPPAEDEVDALFRLAPPDFVAARNALAARLKKDGDTSAANRVKTLPKPSISAWTVNQLYWRHRDAFDRLLATGERFRQAQASRAKARGDELRRLLNERREALSAMARLAADILKASSGTAPAGVMRRVTATLEALSAYGSSEDAPRAGRLVEDVEPPGFATLAALVPQVGDTAPVQAPSRVLAFQKEAPPPPRRKATAAPPDARRQEKQKQARLAAARAARDKAGKALAEARAVARKAQAALKNAAARAKEAERRMVVAEERLQKLAAAAHEARQRARHTAVHAESAAQAAEEAELALQRAPSELKRLEGR